MLAASLPLLSSCDDSPSDSPSATGGAAGAPIDSGPPPTEPPIVSDLSVEPNPNSTISCYVSWTTDVVGDSEVWFGIDDYEFRIVDDTQVTDHRVLVIGMYADSEYRIRAVSTNAEGTDDAETTWTTGSLPPEVPLAELTVDDFDASQVGWTLTNISHGSRPQPPAAIVMYDQYGIPVWYFVNGDTPDTRGDVDVRQRGNSNR